MDILLIILAFRFFLFFFLFFAQQTTIKQISTKLTSIRPPITITIICHKERGAAAPIGSAVCASREVTGILLVLLGVSVGVPVLASVGPIYKKKGKIG